MKLTCFITVCACLSSTVSTINEVEFLNRINRVTRPQEELVIKDVTARREINPTPRIYSNIFPTSQQFQPQIRIERPKRNQSGFQQQPQPQPQQQQQQQQQQHRYNRDRSKYSAKRVKTRSIIGTSTIELSDNQLNQIPEAIPDEKPIRIEPVFRVTKKKNVLESIIEILHQLLDPPKNEKGPLVPIQMPGSTRKIYLRLIEPLDSSQVMVRFVTQLPVPVVDVEKQHNPYIPIPSIIDPVGMLLNHGHHGTIHPIYSNDALLASSSSNRHHAIHPPRGNVSHVKGSQSIKPTVENPSKDHKGNLLPAIVSNGAESNKNHFTDPRGNMQNHEQQLLSQSAASYYQYQQAAEEEVMNKVKELFNSENATTIEGGAQNPWYHQLSTHRLPLRQIAPLYPMDHGSISPSSGSYADTYKPSSDVLPGSNSYSIPYEQYNDAANLAPEAYPSSYNVPSSYATFYKQNEVNGAPSSYSVPYQNQNEFNGASTSYSVPYADQNKYNEAPPSYATSYEKQNDSFGASSVYSSSYQRPPNVSPSSNSYEKPANVPPSSNPYEKQIGASSNDALRVIDPPPFFPDYRTRNHVNRSFEHSATAIRQSRYNDNLVDLSNIGGGSSSHVIYGKSKREESETDLQKNETGFQKSAEIDDKRWQPVAFVRENSGWQEAYEAELAKVATTKRQSFLEEDRPTRKPLRGNADQARRSSKHRGGAIARDPRCSTSWGEDVDCERAKSTTTSTTPPPESTVRIVEKQAQPVDEGSIASSTTSSLIETSKLSTVTVKSPSDASATERSSSVTTTSPNNKIPKSTEASPLLIKIIGSDSATERQPLLIRALDSPFTNVMAEKLIATEASVIKPTMKNVTQKPKTNNTTEKSLKSNGTTGKSSKSNGTIEKSLKSNSTTEKLFKNTTKSLTSNKARKPEPKRPMVMKKSTFVVKKPESSSSTTKRPVTTQKPKTTTIVSSVTKITTVTRKAKFPKGSLKTKSSTSRSF